MFPTRKLTAATLALALASVPATSVIAQEAAETQAPETQMQEPAQTESQAETQGGQATMPDAGSESAQDAPETPDFDEATLDAFASAVIDVTEIRDEYVPQLEAAETPQVQQTILAEANEKMRVAIEETQGITVDDYMAINRAATMDEELNARIAQRITDMMDADAG